MVLVLALVTSVTYGVADFCGGLATRRSDVWPVLLLGGPVGTVLLLVAALPVGGRVGPAAVPGLLAGTAGALGVVVFYRALAEGTMSVVAPVTALTSAAVPVAVGVGLRGERPGLVAGAGVVCALVALVLVGLEPRRPDAPGRRASPGAGVLLALASGTGFGLFFVALSTAPPDVGLWPVVWARVVTVAVVVVGAVLARRVGLPGRDALVPALAAGVLDAAANVGVLLALRGGDIAVPSVVISLYPAATVALAALVLQERLATVQRFGLVTATAGVVLLAV